MYSKSICTTSLKSHQASPLQNYDRRPSSCGPVPCTLQVVLPDPQGSDASQAQASSHTLLRTTAVPAVPVSGPAAVPSGQPTTVSVSGAAPVMPLVLTTLIAVFVDVGTFPGTSIKLYNFDSWHVLVQTRMCLI